MILIVQDNTTAANKSKTTEIRTLIEEVKIMNSYCYNNEID